MLSFQVQVSRRGEILFHPAEGLSSRDEIIFHPAKRNFQKICENTKHIFLNYSSVSYTIKLLGIYFLQNPLHVCTSTLIIELVQAEKH